MANPTRHHFGTAKRILKYGAGTLNNGMWYKTTNDFHLTCYTNSDWVKSTDDQRSATGNVFLLGTESISWCSKKQNVVALSTT